MPEVKEESTSAYESKVATNSKPFHRINGYEKTDGTMSYSIVCVISGGEKRERDFLKTLIRHKDLDSLRVAFISKEGQGLQPYQMQEQWEEIQRSKTVAISNMVIKLDEMDKVFLLSDVDEFHSQLVKIIENLGEEAAGEWIISNPCFEIWLYYCYCNDPEVDLKSIYPLEPEQRSQEMKRLGHEVVAGGLNSLKAFEHMYDGISHSTCHYAEDEYGIPALYATQMHRVAKYLVETMNRNRGEYDEFVKRQQEWRNKMRKSRYTDSTQ
ncbi:MAG: RloB family protein [Lepagella sp.]